MACKLPLKSAAKNAKDYLVTRNIIDTDNNILDKDKFTEQQIRFREHGLSTYGIDDDWISEDNGKLVYNLEVFDKVDGKRKIPSKSTQIPKKPKLPIRDREYYRRLTSVEGDENPDSEIKKIEPITNKNVRNNKKDTSKIKKKVKDNLPP